MKGLLKITFGIFFLCLTGLVQADFSSSEISGKIYDEITNESLPYATVEVRQNGLFLHGSTADENGLYTIKPIGAGKYDLVFRFVGYKPLEYKGVIVSTSQVTYLDIGLTVDMGKEIVFKSTRIFETPLIEIDKVPGMIYTSSVIKDLPTRNANDVLSLTVGTYQSDIGEPIQVRGSRPGSTLYLLDGMKVNSFSGIPSSAIDQLQVISGGIPAKYGDTTGGVIILNTK